MNCAETLTRMSLPPGIARQLTDGDASPSYTLYISTFMLPFLRALFLQVMGEGQVERTPGSARTVKVWPARLYG